MKSVQTNYFRATCPTCSSKLSDETYVDRSGPMLFYRTRFECGPDNWALMTRLDEYNAIGPVDENGSLEVPDSVFAQVKLDLTLAYLGHFVSQGVRNYPLDTVEKYVENGDTFYSKKMTGTASAFLHIFYAGLAASYAQRAEADKQLVALESAVAYLMQMEGDELFNARQEEIARRDALQIFASLSSIYRLTGKTEAANRVNTDSEIWLLRNPDVAPRLTTKPKRTRETLR